MSKSEHTTCKQIVKIKQEKNTTETKLQRTCIKEMAKGKKGPRGPSPGQNKLRNS